MKHICEEQYNTVVPLPVEVKDPRDLTKLSSSEDFLDGTATEIEKNNWPNSDNNDLFFQLLAYMTSTLKCQKININLVS